MIIDVILSKKLIANYPYSAWNRMIIFSCRGTYSIPYNRGKKYISKTEITIFGTTFVRYYYENRIVRMAYKEKNGKKHGKYRGYSIDGKLEIDCTFKNGKLHGKFIRYFNDGRPCQITHYEDSIRDGVYKQYYSNGNLIEDGIYKNGEKDGVCKEYYENGNLREEGTYRDGELNGDFRTYYDNGNPGYIAYYKNGKIHGNYKIYRENYNIITFEGFESASKDGLTSSYKQYNNNDGFKSVIYGYYNKIYGYCDETLEYIYAPDGTLLKEFYACGGASIDIQYLVNNHCAEIKDELITHVLEPERIERFAASTNMTFQEYLATIS